VRENGGQYTHAAIWAVMAFAAAGEVERAWELWDLINPVRHGDSRAAIATYMVEPYVVAADVYANPQHAGRGGWTWYTGAAGWMYRLLIESLLGVHLEVDRLRLAPLLPASWPGFTMQYRFRETSYDLRFVVVAKGARVRSITCDGHAVPAVPFLPLHDDRLHHAVVIELGD
jgi:cellobiose phosphorylase